jgi:hypothetical protein
VDILGATLGEAAQGEGLQSTQRDRHSFVWQTESSMARQAEQEKNKLSQVDGNIFQGNFMGGHKTQLIPLAFLATTGLLSGDAQICKGRVFPILITGSGDRLRKTDFRILAEVNLVTGKGPVALRQLLVPENQETWISAEAKQYLVNETSLALRKIVLNTYNQHNPMKHWEDAMWYYRWIEDGTRVSHCVIMVFIPAIGKEVPLQKPERYRWELVYDEIRNLLMETDVLRELHKIEDPMALMMKILLGNNLFEVELPPL